MNSEIYLIFLLGSITATATGETGDTSTDQCSYTFHVSGQEQCQAASSTSSDGQITNLGDQVTSLLKRVDALTTQVDEIREQITENKEESLIQALVTSLVEQNRQLMENLEGKGKGTDGDSTGKER